MKDDNKLLYEAYQMSLLDYISLKIHNWFQQVKPKNALSIARNYYFPKKEEYYRNEASEIVKQISPWVYKKAIAEYSKDIPKMIAYIMVRGNLYARTIHKYDPILADRVLMYAVDGIIQEIKTWDENLIPSLDNLTGR